MKLFIFQQSTHTDKPHPQPNDYGDLEIDAEALVVLTDVKRLLNAKSSRRMVAPCVQPNVEVLGSQGIRMLWLGSYREDPEPVEFTTLLKGLAPRSLIVLGAGIESSKSATGTVSERSMRHATRLLQQQGVARRRILVLADAGVARRSRAAGAQDAAPTGVAENTRKVLRLGAKLVEPDWAARAHEFMVPPKQPDELEKPDGVVGEGGGDVPWRVVTELRLEMGR